MSKVVAVCLWSIATLIWAQSPREQLQQYVIQLQATPSDDALRTKIIQLALTLNPTPVPPEEAQADDGKAKTLFAHAASPDDMKAAASAFFQASLLAPWVPEYYFNEAAAEEKAEQYDQAIHALNFYLVAAPNASDAGEVRGRIDGLRFEKAKGAASAEQEIQEQEQEAAHNEQRFINNLIGTWEYDDRTNSGVDTYSLSTNNGNSFSLLLTNAGRVRGALTDFEVEYSGQIAGKQLSGTYRESEEVRFCSGGRRTFYGRFTGSVADDGQTIVVDVTHDDLNGRCQEMETNERIVFRKR